MKFEEAAKSGKRIRPVREDGETVYSEKVYFYFKGNILYMNTAQNEEQPAKLYKHDYLYDWEIVKEKKEKEIPVEEIKKKLVCKICGSVDDTWTAYCGKCGRSLHTIVEEKKTLSERIVCTSGSLVPSECEYSIDVKYIEKAINRLYNYLCSTDIEPGFRTKLKEIFGERLIK